MSVSAPVAEDVVIVGGGPAGYTAAVYLARADLRPLVVEGSSWGGLLQETTEVDNFPGFPRGVFGPQLMSDMREQAERFGARFVTDDATSIRLAADGGSRHAVTVDGIAYTAAALVLATGARHRRLGVPGEDALSGRGVSYCATCDAAFFRGRSVCVVGGGDSAMEEALFLARFASRVTIVHRRDDLRASAAMRRRVDAVDTIDRLTPYEVEEFVAGPDGALAAVRLRHRRDGGTRELPTAAAFVAVGHHPRSELVRGQLPLDDQGYVRVLDRSTRTAVPGVFAAGDLVDHTYRQAITAAGSGCQAALDTQSYLAALAATV